MLYNSTQCEGSAMPYPIPQESVSYPDSLTPVMINHVGRHGARYPASAARPLAIKRALQHADSLGTITPLGKELLTLTENVIERSNGKWGALDSLGIAEQRGIASRMFANYPNLFANGKVTALSSYAPRCIMSMYSFTHQLARMNNRLEIFTSSGRQNSPLMRPFDLDQDYIDYREDKPYDDALKAYIAETAPTAPIKRVLGDDYPLNEEQMRDLAITEYGLLAGLSAMGYNVDVMRFLTIEEYNSLWSCNNLKQYLERTANTISTVPADITADLLMNLITTTDEVAERRSDMRVQLRFGHAETLMPLLSLMHLDGCYYMTNYFDTVSSHWHNFYVVPMASNLQLILFRAKSGKLYLRVDLNMYLINI
ncbi:MAG: histidine phosphatase family protein [Muribaculum sp.]|nr:histidine phosphatase family protein [Muribaculum sp.]